MFIWIHVHKTRLIEVRMGQQLLAGQALSRLHFETALETVQRELPNRMPLGGVLVSSESILKQQQLYSQLCILRCGL